MSSIRWFTFQTTTMTRLKPTARNSIRGSRTQVCHDQDPLPTKCIISKSLDQKTVAGTQTRPSNVGCNHPKWWPNLLCHNAHPRFHFLSKMLEINCHMCLEKNSIWQGAHLAGENKSKETTDMGILGYSVIPTTFAGLFSHRSQNTKRKLFGIDKIILYW